MNDYFIAVVDDDQHIRNLVEAYLVKENFRTIGLSSAEEAWVLWQNDPPDLWVLDIMLPGMDGYELCRRIREEADVPIVIISAKDSEVDKIMGLEFGSDDYLVKPFSPRELVARVKRHLQRWYKLRPSDEIPEAASAQLILKIGPLRLLPEERRVFWDKHEVDLTFKEFSLLQAFAEHPNRAFTREELLILVWGDDYFGSDRAVDHLIKRLRKKIEQLPIEAVWGHGYRMRAEGGDLL
ncbi:response regulator transcription factor [Paenibacillus timonensis]|jgi:two-component system, OmpR family, response regulator CssR|uniref:Response regulator transcription factor n=1 Tax=Paenibacillus timonensis TaxID=225915 RepID=A0ABW3SBQ4_9BACL|nr:MULTISPECIES: response regulator transcription factor [Paenibacillus]MCH1640777.1 response regulator transcription factor [Paenibacillus timonensis]MDU2238970.1 response regulator transcription factor [Paenibacillus sp.]GJM81257.1 DNA-binding response regulator [Paenibacillus sp. HMSSN-139]